MEGLNRAVQRVLDIRKGSLRPVAAAMGLRPTSFSHWTRRKLPRLLRRLERLLRALGVEPRAWLHRATAPTDVLGLVEALAPARAPRVVRQLRRVAKRLPAPGPSLARGHVVEASPELAARLCEGDCKLRVHRLRQGRWITRPAEALEAVALLEEFRHSRPGEAAQLARALALEVAPRMGEAAAEIYCRAAGVLASCHRMTGDLPTAAGVLAAALPWAELFDQEAVLADLYERAGYLFRDRLLGREARGAAVEARILYTRLGDRVGVAKTLADEGIFRYWAGDSAGARPLLEEALESLPAELKRYRLGVTFALATALQDMGKPLEAAGALAAAEGLLGPDEPYNRACVLRGRGDALLRAGKVATAEACYQEARDLFLRVNPFAAAAVSLDLLGVLLRRGRRAEAEEAAEAMGALLQPLTTNHGALAAIAQVVQRAAALTPEDVAAARRALEAARPRAGQPHPAGA